MGTTKTKKEKTLTDFTFDDSADFFGIKEVENLNEIDTSKVVEKVKEDEEEKEEVIEDLKKKEDENEDENYTTDKKTKKDEDETERTEDNEKEEEFFKDDTTNTQKEDDEEDLTVTDTVKTFNFLKEKGVIEIEEDEEIDFENLDDDKVFEYIDRTLDKKLEEEIENFANGLDEEAKLFIKFKKEGGKTSDFLNSLKSDAIVEDISIEDLEDEKTQEDFLIQYYNEFEDMTEEEAEDKVEWLKERDKLSNTAKNIFEKINERKTKEKQRLIEEQKKINKKKEDDNKKYVSELKQTLNDTEIVGKVKITKKDKIVLFDYMMKPTIKTESGRYVTEFQKDLAEIYSDKKMLIGFAKVVKEKLNIEDLEAKTQVTKEIKKTLRKTKENRKSLTDFF